MSEKLEVISNEHDAVFIPAPEGYGMTEYRHLYSGVELAVTVIGQLMRSGSHGLQVGNRYFDVGAIWFKNGVECRVLSPGTTDWRKGKILLCFKFVPDEEPVQGELVGEVKQLAPASTEVMPETSDQPE